MKKDGTLILEHEHDGRDLELSEANKVFEQINTLWHGGVKFTTVIEDDQEIAEYFNTSLSNHGSNVILTSYQPLPFFSGPDFLGLISNINPSSFTICLRVKYGLSLRISIRLVSNLFLSFNFSSSSNSEITS